MEILLRRGYTLLSCTEGIGGHVRAPRAMFEASPAGLHGDRTQEVNPYRFLEPVVCRDVNAAGFVAAIVGMDPHDARNV